MKKALLINVLGILSLGVIGCNSFVNENNNELPETQEEIVENNDEHENSEESAEKDSSEEVDEGDTDETSNISGGEFEDQIDLRVGDTGQIADTIGEFEVTLNTVESIDEVDGEQSPLDIYILASVTVKNIGESTLDSNNIIDSFEITHNLEGSGYGDYSHRFEDVNEIIGNIEPGEEVDGELIFTATDAENLFIRINSGLVTSGAVKNQTIWTFDKSEAE